MNRQEALEWCVENLVVWGVESDHAGWYWESMRNNRLFFLHVSHERISEQDWLEAKAAKKSEKWTPKVGEECEANLIGRPTFICIPHFFKDGKVWFTEVRDGKGDRDFIYRVDELEFRPLRTQEEIEREELCELIDSCNMSSGILADLIMSAGYRKL